MPRKLIPPLNNNNNLNVENAGNLYYDLGRNLTQYKHSINIFLQKSIQQQ
jgi:hypothetical protein